MKLLIPKVSKDIQTIAVNSQYFKTDHIESDLVRISARGGGVTVIATSGIFMMKMGATMVLARLLTPQDYGLFGMVTAITIFFTMFKDMGLSMATIQRADIDHSQISTLFWINLTFSVLLMLLTAALSPVIGWFYGDQRLIWVTLAMGSALVFGGLTVQHEALLRRQMRFISIAAIDIISLLVGVTAAIIAAWCGAHYWALVLQELVIAIASFIGVWIMCRWRPGLPVRGSGVKAMLAFGANLSGFSILNYFIRNLDKVLIGRWWGSFELGLYNKSYQLLLLPIQQFITPISSVVVPALSRLQGNPSNYRSYYCKVLNLAAFFTAPLTVSMVVLSDEIILILLGNQWLRASIIFKVLAIAGFWQPLSGSTGWIFMSLGQADKMMRWAIFSTPIYILAFVIGLPRGGLGVAIAYTICDYFIRIPLLHMAFKDSPISWSDFIGAIWRPVLLSILMYPIMLMIRHYFPQQNSILTILYSCVAGYGFFIATISIWPRARTEASGILTVIKKLRNKVPVNETYST